MQLKAKKCEVEINMLGYAITTYNEEKNIRGCISSLMESGVERTEIFIIDSISEDLTVEIASNLGVSILQQPFTDMASQRNFAFREISLKCPRITYVCILDADERISSEFHQELLSAIKAVDATEFGHAFAICRKMIFNGHWVKRASRFPVYIDRVGHIRSTKWKNAGHGEFLVAGGRTKIKTPLLEDDKKGIESMLRRHVSYARNEALRPIHNGKHSFLKEFALGYRGNYVFIFIYFFYLYVLRGVMFRDRRERDYAMIKVMYEIQILLFKRYD